MILDSPKIKNAILTALADPEVVSVLDCTMVRSKSVCDVIRETGMPHTTAYRKIKMACRRKASHADGKKYSLFHSVFRSLIVRYENNKILVEAEQNIDSVELLTERFFPLGQEV